MRTIADGCRNDQWELRKADCQVLYRLDLLQKARSSMLHKCVKNKVQITGGIIHYVNGVQEKGLEQKFFRKNFVFDNILGAQVTDDLIATCHRCGAPADI